MASNVSELVVSLGLNTASFNNKINEVNRTMKLVESQFKNSGAGVKDFEKSAQGLSSKLNALNGKLDGAKTKIGLYNEEIKKTKTSLNEQNKKLDESKKKVEALKTQYDNSVSTLGKNAKATKELKEELTLAEKVMGKNEKTVLNTSNKLKTLETNLNNTEAEFKELTTEIQTTQKTLNGLSWTQVSNNLNQLSEKFTNAGDKMIDVGKKMSVVSVAIAGLGIAATSTASEFEASMARVQATSGATGAELESLKDKAKEMGATTKFSASESAEAMNYMAMAGWKTNQMIDGLDGIMNLAAASGEDLAMVSDIVTDSLTAFGLEAGDSAKFADILAAASSNANTNVAMMGETFKYVAPVAGSLGYSAEDTAVAIGLMGNAGIKASQAGTSLRQIMLGLGTEVELATKSNDNLKISMTESDGSMRNLNDIIVDLRSAFGDMTESQQALNAENIAGKIGMSGLLAIVNAGEEDFNKLTVAINNSNGVSKKMADIMNNTTKGQMTLLKSQLEGLAIQIGDKLLPYVNNFIKTLSNLMTKFDGLSDGTKDFIIKVAGVTAIMGPLLIVIGTLSKSFGNILTLGSRLSKMMGKFKASTAAVSAASKGASSAAAGLSMSFGKLAVAALPIAGVVAALTAGVVIYSKNAKVMNGNILDTTDNMGPLERALDKLNGGFSKSKSELENMGLVYKDFNSNISDEFIQKVEASTKSINELSLYLAEINIDKNLNQDEIKNFQSRVAEMCSSTINTIKEHQKESNASISEMFLTDGIISEQEQKVLTLLQKNSETQIKETQTLQDEINAIIANAVDRKEGLNEKEIEAIENKVKRIKQIELEALGASQEEYEYAKNEFIARISGIDLEGARSLLSDKIKIRDEEKIKIAASYDTNIAMLQNHLKDVKEEDRAAVENEINNAIKAKEEKLKIQDDLYNEYLRVLGEKNPEILNHINRFNAELLTKQDLKAQAALEKMQTEYRDMDKITEDGCYQIYNTVKKSWRDVRIEVDEATGEIIGAYDTYSGKSGGYTKEIVEQLGKLQVEYARMRFKTEKNLKDMENSTVDAQGNIVDSFGKIIGTLSDVKTASDGTRTGILDLNGTPVEVKVDGKNAISNLYDIKKAIDSIPSVKNINVNTRSPIGGGGNATVTPMIAPMPYSTDVVPQPQQRNVFGYQTPETLTTMQINSGYSSVGSPSSDNIQRLSVSRSGGTSTESNTDKLLKKVIELLAANNSQIIEVPVNIDGKQIAKASAKYMSPEIDNINLRKNRLGGAF